MEADEGDWGEEGWEKTGRDWTGKVDGVDDRGPVKIMLP